MESMAAFNVVRIDCYAYLRCWRSGTQEEGGVQTRCTESVESLVHTYLISPYNSQLPIIPYSYYHSGSFRMTRPRMHSRIILNGPRLPFRPAQDTVSTPDRTNSVPTPTSGAGVGHVSTPFFPLLLTPAEHKICVNVNK